MTLTQEPSSEGHINASEVSLFHWPSYTICVRMVRWLTSPTRTGSKGSSAARPPNKELAPH
jgi:hypothetical protein